MTTRLRVRQPRWRYRDLTPRARLLHAARLNELQFLNRLALQDSHDLQAESPQMSNVSGRWTDALYVNYSDFNAYASSATEASLIAGTNRQPAFPALFFDEQGRAVGKAFQIMASGIISNTGTPTIIFQLRLSSSVGTGVFSGASIGVSAAITTASSVSNQWWYLSFLMAVYTVGQGTGNTTLSGSGSVRSPLGFASPLEYPLEPTTPPTATWTQTIDNTLTQYLNLSATWGTNSASNTITCKQLVVSALN